MGAAGKVFATTAYAFATVDDIIRTAGVSRATFYMHFETKLALALEIYNGITDDWLQLFDRLAEADPKDRDALKGWVASLANLYAEHGYITSLVAQLSVLEPSFRDRLRTDRDAAIARLADREVEGFVQAMAEGEAGALQHARAHLLLRRLDQVCSDVSIADESDRANSDRYITLAVEELVPFLGRKESRA